jgi:hypothetical protein
MIALRGLHPILRASAEEAVRWAQAHGVPPRVTSVNRTWRQQQVLYNKHLECKRQGRYPWAPGCQYPANPPGWSAHEYRLAWDSVVPSDHMAWWADVRRAVGFHVPPHDRIHAEHPQAPQYVRWVNEQQRAR